MTTGSTVYGTIPGLATHFKGVAHILSCQGDPDGIVSPFLGTSTASGGTVAFDSADNQYYKNIGGSTWMKLGSTA